MWKRNLAIPSIWVLVLALNAQNFFFWDTIQLSSKQASFFFDGHFSSFFLPREINSGHPPFYGISLAVFWKLFGQSLLTSHIFNSFFVLGFIFQAHRLGQFFIGDKKAFWFPVVLFCNPVFLGHSILVSPDNALIFLFALGLNSILRRKVVWLILATIFLAILSMRGMMVVLSLFLGELIWTYLKDKSMRLDLIPKYIYSGVAALMFLGSHYLHNNWLGFHEDSPWQESFQVVSILGYLKNIGLVCWRLLDFGNLFIIIGIILMLNKSNFKNKYFQFFLAFILAFSVVFVLPLSSFKYLTAHRYFMPIYALLSFSFITMAVEYNRNKLKFLVLILLILGNCWIYPRSISQGWDVTLGHLPFYHLVEEMNGYIIKENIDIEQVGSEFPLKSESKFLYLDDRKPSYQEARVGEKPFIIYSKVINEYRDHDYYKLQKEYTLRKTFNILFISVELYEKRKETQVRGIE